MKVVLKDESVFFKDETGLDLTLRISWKDSLVRGWRRVDWVQ